MSETRAETTDSVSAELLVERLRLFGLDIAINVYYTSLNYTPCRDDSDRVEGSIAQLTHLDAQIAKVATWLTEWER